MSFRLVATSVWKNPGNRGQRLQHLARAIGWQARKRLLRAPTLLELPNGVLFRAYPDCVVSSALVYAAWPEYHELQFIRGIIRRGEIVLDVGANVGHIGLLLADIVGPAQLSAFEPTPVTFRRLTENWKLNGWDTDSLYHLAVGATVSTIRLPDPTSPLTTNAIAAANSSSRLVEVPIITLDSLRDNWHGRTIGLLKVDVEGYEREVFRGADALLEHDRPRLVMFESLSGSLDREIGRMLERHRYDVFQLTDGVPDFSLTSAQNLFAAPREERATLERPT